MELNRLLYAKAPWLHLLRGTETEARDAIASLQKSSGQKIICPTIHGDKAQTKAALFDEFIAALQFPDYFGRNWDALDECLADLYLLPADAYMLQIAKAVHLLEKEPPKEQMTFFQILERSGQEWSKSVSGEWKRPPKPFHVVLPCAEEEPTLRERLDMAKVGYDVLH